MRAVVQRVSEAKVEVVEESGATSISGEVGAGFLVLVGVHREDTLADARYLAEKIAHLRVFDDEEGKLNRSLLETNGAVLLVSNFTLYGDCRKGRRPGFTEAANGENAKALYFAVGTALEVLGIEVQYGVFATQMKVMLANDGPITLLLDSRKNF